MKTITKHSLPVLYLALSLPLFSQEVVAPAGNYHKSPNHSISWTIGEAVIESFSAGAFQLTQGFQQGDLVVSTLACDLFIDLDIKAFPNPVRDYVTLSVDRENVDNIGYMLFTMEGRLVDQQALNGTETNIDFKDLEPGGYFVRVMKGSDLLATFKIVKY